MKVLYDYQALFLQKYGGVSRYFYEVINGIRKMHPEDDLEVNAAVSINYYFRNEITMRKKRLRHGNAFLNNLGIYASLQKSVLFRRRFDIIHPTFYYDDYLFKYPTLLCGSKIVVTIHDMIHERMGEDHSTIEAKRKSLYRADGIIAVSEYTKNDMLDIYPDLIKKPIKVIYHGNSLEDSLAEMDSDFPVKYILFLGRRDGYKNFDVLIEAFKRVNNIIGDLFLVVSGGGDFSEEELAKINRAGIGNRIRKKDLSDEMLAKAYKGALAFVFPSKYEGFGIPIVEAFSQGCPVILSNSTCFPEIAGDAGVYFNPDSPEGLAQRIVDICYNESLRKKLIEAGRERLNSFSWERSAIETREFYCSLIGE